MSDLLEQADTFKENQSHTYPEFYTGIYTEF